MVLLATARGGFPATVVTSPAGRIKAVATCWLTAVLTNVSRRDFPTNRAGRRWHGIHFPNRYGRNMMMRTTSINTIARIISPFTESLSVPNIIGIGPIRRTPAARVFSEPRVERNARRIIAAKARTNPKMISMNPTSVTEGASKRSHLLKITRMSRGL